MSQLTLFAEDSPASPSLLPGSDWARQMTVTSGLSISGLSKNSGPLGSLEKMLLASSIWASTMCYLTWKAQGTPQGHLLYRLSPSMRNTEETDSGLWPTVTATANQLSPSMQGRYANPIWPTPTASTGGANHNSPTTIAGKRFGMNLAGAAAMWPTPTAHMAKEAAYPAEFNRQSPTLAATVAMRTFPTPQASDNRDRGNMSNPSIQRRVAMGKQIMLSQSVDQNSGQLNPTWVEWLMGYPIGWTDLKD